MKFSHISIITSSLLLAACTATPTDQESTSSSSASSMMQESSSSSMSADNAMMNDDVSVTPISHATMVLNWDDTIMYTDPVGGAEAFALQPAPDLVLITDTHGDHLSVETLEAVTTDDTIILAPQAVFDELSDILKTRTRIIANGETVEEAGFSIEGIPMYNLPESDDSRHVKGRGNGYVVEHDGTRVYISGDTAGIPEMRNLEDIDIAFVCMNVPYTMDAEEAANAVLDFAPKTVYPYHYRQPDGFADVALFKQMVNDGNPDITVVQLDWYAE